MKKGSYKLLSYRGIKIILFIDDLCHGHFQYHAPKSVPYRGHHHPNPHPA